MVSRRACRCGDKRPVAANRGIVAAFSGWEGISQQLSVALLMAATSGLPTICERLCGVEPFRGRSSIHNRVNLCRLPQGYLLRRIDGGRQGYHSPGGRRGGDELAPAVWVSSFTVGLEG